MRREAHSLPSRAQAPPARGRRLGSLTTVGIRWWPGPRATQSEDIEMGQRWMIWDTRATTARTELFTLGHSSLSTGLQWFGQVSLLSARVWWASQGATPDGLWPAQATSSRRRDDEPLEELRSTVDVRHSVVVNDEEMGDDGFSEKTSTIYCRWTWRWVDSRYDKLPEST